jgi:hypothetical protein
LAILNVGSDQTYATIAAAVAASRDGDTVRVQAGTYTNDFAEISTRITLEGVGGMVQVRTTVPPPDGKAVFTTNTDVTFDRFDISGAAVADQNGAAIRQQGGNLTILNSHIHHNQMGLLTTSDPDATLTIRGSEFDHNGNGAEHTHNLYVNGIARLTVDDSYFHDAEIGHQLKSRAAETIVTNSRFADLEGTGSYSIDAPNGGRVVLRDNVLEQGPNSDNPAIVAFGEEGDLHTGSSLEMGGTTVINRYPGGTLLWNAAGAPATVSGTEVHGLDADQLVSGPATVTGTTFLDAAPALDTSSPWQVTAGTPEEPTPEPTPEDPGTPTDPVGEEPATPEDPGKETPEEPAAGGDAPVFTLENAGAGVLGKGIATLGQVFAQGELPAGAGLVARIGGAAVPVQVDVKTTWPDGSAKMAVLSVERPALAAGASVDVALERAAVPGAAPAVDLAAAAGGHSFTVDLAVAGGAPVRIDVLAALKAALADGTASAWQQGALAAQARVEIAIPDTSMRLVFDVTAFKGGGLQVDAQFNNDRAMEAAGGRLDYGVTVRMDGREVARETLSQAQYQNWHREFSSNGTDGGQGAGDPSGGWLNIRQDVAGLARVGAVADYDLTLAVPEAVLAGYQAATAGAGWGDPFAPNGVTTDMPTAGGRADLGITTAANTHWLISQDPRAAAYALGQAEAASGVTWNFWDAAHGTWLNTDNYPRIWVDGRGGTGTPGDPASTGLTQQREGYQTTGWYPERAHQPDLSYVPYLMTGERWILDNLGAQAAWNLTELWPAPRQDGLGLLVDTSMMQTRSAAWGMRQVENAAWAAPDGSAEKAFFTAVADTNWRWLAEQLPRWTAEQGEAHGWLPTLEGNWQLAPWQQDYFASIAIIAASRGNQDAMAYLDWARNFLVGRFQAQDEGFNSRDGAAFIIAVRDPATGAILDTWAEIGAATAAAGLSNGDGWAASQGEYARLALSTLAGLYHLTGDQEALAAYKALVALDPPFTTAADFAANPNYAVTIPGLYSGTNPAIGGPPAPTTPAKEPAPQDPGTPTDPADEEPGGEPAAPEGPGDEQAAPDPADGLVLDGTRRGDVLTGGASDDTITGGGGRDRLTGGEGADIFVYGSRHDRGDHITDFDPAGDGDRLDLTGLLRGDHPQDLAGLIDEGYLRLSERWGDVRVSVDRDGGGDGFRTLVTLDDQTIAGLGDHVVIA